MKIRVEQSVPVSESIYVVLRDVIFAADNLNNQPGLMFWLDKDEADKLAFQLNSLLQDMERSKELSDGKAGEELREMQPLEKE